MKSAAQLFGLLLGLPFLIVGAAAMLAAVALICAAMVISRWSWTEGNRDLGTFMRGLGEGMP